jgi:hypothetical protein
MNSFKDTLSTRARMAQIGKINSLTVKQVRDYGAHLDGDESGDILLPKRYVPKDCRPGDTVEVFVFVEGENRLRATTRKPYATVGQFAALRVKANTVSGAFLDWGLEKDLLVPKREQQAGWRKAKHMSSMSFWMKSPAASRHRRNWTGSLTSGRRNMLRAKRWTFSSAAEPT